VVVTYHTTSPHGSMWLVNEGTGAWTSFGFNQPSSPLPNTSYAGDTAEWVVERPQIGGVLADLENYGSNFFIFPSTNSGGLAYGAGNYNRQFPNVLSPLGSGRGLSGVDPHIDVIYERPLRYYRFLPGRPGNPLGRRWGARSTPRIGHE